MTKKLFMAIFMLYVPCGLCWSNQNNIRDFLREWESNLLFGQKPTVEKYKKLVIYLNDLRDINNILENKLYIFNKMSSKIFNYFEAMIKQLDKMNYVYEYNYIVESYYDRLRDIRISAVYITEDDFDVFLDNCIDLAEDIYKSYKAWSRN